ncbi:serine/threonine protein kinase [Nocardioides sp. HDW12B]|uniref:serine/threonine-protein kinase n=1 Tax=Nocardioides sp. HDW12B TaxID=2714939 RepID=UPI00140B669C|nr:serine/threonine-protein kinase [Nocardioides sp. HDW12B]QIK67028.1 serine/threonine protein kinase [Nocardioides sp. HDW12B]
MSPPSHPQRRAVDPDDRRVGPYRVLARIGEGGMGVVHLAEAPDGRRVALKVLRPHVVGDDEGRERLAREVASLRKVRSGHVAEIIDADPWGELAFIVTRYVPGDSLTELVKREGPVRGADLDHLADHLLAAIRDVHASGVLHRDVKPTNVVMEGRSPVLIDFGLARLAEDPAMTATGILLGTPGYLAPELLLGDQPTGAVDVHGWASTVVFAAQGVSPYGRGHTMAILDRTRRGEFAIADVPAGIRPLLAAALAPDPLERPTTHEVAVELERLRGDDRPTAALAVAPPLAPDPAGPTGLTEPPGATAPWQAVSHDPPTLVTPASHPAGHRASHPATTPLTAVAPVARAAPAAAPPVAPAVAAVPSDPRLAHPPAHIARSWPPPPSATSVQPVPMMAPVAGHPRPEGAFQPPLSGWARGRRATMLVLLVLLVAAATRLAPYLTVGVVATVAVVARATTRSRDALWRRRGMRGRTWSDGPRTVLGYPWHLAATAAGSAALLLVAGLAVTITVLGAAGVLGVAPAAALTAGGVVLAWAVWWGPGSSRVRRSVLPVLTGLARPGSRGLLTLAGLAAVTGLLWVVQPDAGTLWFPSDGPPWSGWRAQVDGWVRLP